MVKCIYIKPKGRRLIILVLYVDYMLLVSSDKNMLRKRIFLSLNFDMKYVVEAASILGIEVHQDRSKGVLGLSHKSYIDKILRPPLKPWKNRGLVR